jgi:hypothetical protein
MSGVYADGTPFDFTICTTPFLYSSVITDQSVLAPYVTDTDYLFDTAITLPSFTDDPLTAGTTAVKAVHLTELRLRINDLRLRCGLTPAEWTNGTLVAGVTTIKAMHLTELRNGLDEVYVAAGLNPPNYANATVTGGATVITVVDVAELRTAIGAIW